MNLASPVSDPDSGLELDVGEGGWLAWTGGDGDGACGPKCHKKLGKFLINNLPTLLLFLLLLLLLIENIGTRRKNSMSNSHNPCTMSLTNSIILPINSHLLMSWHLLGTMFSTLSLGPVYSCPILSILFENNLISLRDKACPWLLPSKLGQLRKMSTFLALQ